MFLSKQREILVYLCIYVDDIIIASPTVDEITWLLQLIRLEFPIRDLEDLKFFLSVRVERINRGLHLTQSQYLANLLQSCGMASVKPTMTPMVPNFDLQSKSELLSKPTVYRRIVGSLQYATLTRLDIQLAVN